jgi:hypothetical protein
VILQSLEKELHLCNLLLQKDERNFHCWSYRRFIISCYIFYYSNENMSSDNQSISSTFMTGAWRLLGYVDTEGIDNVGIGAQITVCSIAMNRSPNRTATEEELQIRLAAPTSSSWMMIQQEWDFTTKKIYENFSNFSAFHYRSKLLPLMIQIRSSNASTDISNTTDVASTSIGSETSLNNNETNATFLMLRDEFELITNAIYTEPDDQTAWWYQVYLFHYITTNVLVQNKNDTNDNLQQVVKYHDQIIRPHLEQVRELQNETNNSSKWVLIGLLQCLQFVKKYHINNPTMATSDTSSGDMDVINQERRVILQTLIQIDPDRKERYKNKLNQIR